jgi:hypothetical protein
MATGVQVVFDCADPDSLARFWAEAIGYKLQDPPTGYGSWEDWAREQGIPQERWNDASAVDPDGRGPRLYFQQVPEAKTTKNRVHLDLNISGAHGTPLAERRRRIDAEVARLLGAGATRLGTLEGAGGYVVNMADPEGNEFDVRRSVTLTGTPAGRLGARVPAMCHIRRTSPVSDGQPRSLTCRR